MNNFDIEKFDPNKEALQTMVQGMNNLSINSIDDKEGYKAVHEARMELKRTRVQIKKVGKGLRDDAVKFQKAVIAKEKELVAIIEPTEKELESKQRAIDEEKEMLARKNVLPARKEEFAKIDYEILDEEILRMDDKTYSSFINEKKAEYLEKEEQKIREMKEALETEKQKIKAEKERKERDERIKKETEERVRREVEDRERKDAEELNANTKFKELLARNGLEEGDDFHIRKDGNTLILYKKVDEIII
jgi:hypothetical protein